MKCQWCGTKEVEGKNCDKCGGPIEEKEDFYKSEPFFYNGYIVYTLRDVCRQTVEAQFWLGKELVDRISIVEDVLGHNVPEGCDSMDFFWELFLVSQGEKEVMEWSEKNNKYPATFQLTRIENPEKQYMMSLSVRELAEL